MDTSALVVESNTPLEKVARQAMARDHSKIYDHIIVTDKGVLMGTVAIYSILDKLASLSMEQKPQVLMHQQKIMISLWAEQIV